MFCPFTNDNCSRDCILHRRMTRQYTGKADMKEVEGCVFNLILDELSNHSLQNSMLHKETGEVKNNALYGMLAILGKPVGAKMIAKKVQHLIEEQNAYSTKDNKISP